MKDSVSFESTSWLKLFSASSFFGTLFFGELQNSLAGVSMLASGLS